ncbi:alkaline phosphatase D family protein [Pseudomonas akapageensis]|uniref:alkaline phosphatase D family protein n=1 Tax=Pseudomonas akapageensis TaxID=2609961 RepID=UPI00140D0D94|nr:alkaline phosphatase D family protein [Pseudomonas akapageensis]
MIIKMPTVGPIVGHTTPEQSRIMIRGQHSENSNPLASFSIARYRERGTANWSAPVFNQMMEYNDMTAVMIFNNLEEDTVYEYQCGWFNALAALDDIARQSKDKLVWPTSTYVLKTATANKHISRSFIVGSCRYIHTDRLTGHPLFHDLGDQVFKVMNDKITRRQFPIDGMFLVGDQIYADDLNLVNPAATLESFLSRYRTAFTQEGIAKVLAHVPTYMILDDHEIENNWPAEATARDFESIYPSAIKAYGIYQCSHSPLHETSISSQVSAASPPNKFWYTVSNGRTDWFVLDTRTKRNMNAAPRKILDDEQMNALLKWLIESKAPSKFVVTSVMFFPDLKNDEGDSWKSFPEQRNQILEHIRINKIKNITFISGDVHCSLASRMTHSADPDFCVHTIVSSPLFKIVPLATYAYTYKEDFILDKPEASINGEHYQSTLISRVHSEDNFAYFQVDENGVELNYYGKNGQALEKNALVIPLR